MLANGRIGITIASDAIKHGGEVSLRERSCASIAPLTGSIS
jgi:hypothetical protein